MKFVGIKCASGKLVTAVKKQLKKADRKKQTN
jgi:hypothetical protein